MIAIHRSTPSDFVHFYTLGSVALTRDRDVLYHDSALAARQANLVPSSASLWYPPLYPPQTAVVFAPFAVLSYRAAAIAWAAATGLLYLIVVAGVWRSVRYPGAQFTALAALAFPPFWYIVNFGQNTMLVAAAFAGGWFFLERRRPVLAGLAFGALALKPQFAVVLALVLLYRREWRILSGFILSVAIQGGIASVVFGVSVLADYVIYLPQVMNRANAIEPVVEKTISLRALSRVLPSVIAWPLWALSVAAVLVATIATWKPDVRVRIRVSAVVVASVLTSGHLHIYDMAVVGLPLLWLSPDVDSRRSVLLVTALFATPAITMLLSLGIGSVGGQISMAVSIILLIGLLVLIVQRGLQEIARVKMICGGENHVSVSGIQDA